MTEPTGAVPGHGAGFAPALAFVVAGVLPEGRTAPRLGYRNTGEAHEPGRSVAGEVVAIHDGVTLRFELPAGPVDFILLEPAAVPGSYRIPRLVYAGEEVVDLRRRVITVHEDLADTSAPGGIRVSSQHGRPAVELDVRGLGDAGTGCQVELVLQRDADGVAASEGLTRVLEAMATEREAHQAAVARSTRMLVALAGRIDGLAAGIGAGAADGSLQPSLGERIDGVAAAGSARDARIDALEPQLAALAEVLGRSATEHSLAAVAAAVERSAAEQASLAAALAAALEGAAEARAVSEDGAARDLEHLRQALEAIQGQLGRLTNSVENVFWRRWLRWLRGGGK